MFQSSPDKTKNIFHFSLFFPPIWSLSQTQTQHGRVQGTREITAEHHGGGIRRLEGTHSDSASSQDCRLGCDLVPPKTTVGDHCF